MDSNDRGPSISDQARSDPDYQIQTRSATPGEPTGWGAQGTSGDMPPRSAAVYPPAPAVDPMIRRSSVNPQATVGQAAHGPLAQAPVAAAVPTQVPAAPSAPQDPYYDPNPAYAPAAPAAPSLEGRVGELEADVQKIAGAVGTVLEKLDAVLNGRQAPAMPTLGMPTNTGQLMAGGTPTAGTGAPFAPQPNRLGAQAPMQRQHGPVIPEPTPNTARRDPTVRRVVTIAPDEADLTVSQYIEKHFRLRDQSIDEMAEVLRLEPKEVTDILKELGYQFPDGV